MKFAFVLYRYFPHGGLQCDMMRMLQEALRRGHSVDLYCHDWRSAEPPPEGCRLIVVSSGGLTNHGKMKAFAGAVRKRLAAGYGSYDSVTVFNRMGGGDLYFAADNCLAEEWQQKHHLWMLKLNPRYRTFLELEQQVCAKDSPCRIMYIVPRQKEQYQHAYGLPDERFRYLPPGMNTACRRPENWQKIRQKKRAELGIAEDELLLMLVGSNFRCKGGDRVVRAAASLPEQFRKKMKVCLVGACSPAGCNSLAESLGIADQVTFTGGRSDVPALLQAADLMIHPARSEATGTVLIEAIAAGLPVVATKACGFWNFAAEIDPVLAVDEPFSQESLNKTVLYALEHLPKLKEQTAICGMNADFYRRAEIAVDLMEQTGTAKQK